MVTDQWGTGGFSKYRILESNQLNYREIGVAPVRVARIAEALELLNLPVPLPL